MGRQELFTPTLGAWQQINTCGFLFANCQLIGDGLPVRRKMFGRFNFIKRRSHPKTFHVLALDGTTHTYELEVSDCMRARVS